VKCELAAEKQALHKEIAALGTGPNEVGHK
jgi:hypothetical protein